MRNSKVLTKRKWKISHNFLISRLGLMMTMTLNILPIQNSKKNKFLILPTQRRHYSSIFCFTVSPWSSLLSKKKETKMFICIKQQLYAISNKKAQVDKNSKIIIQQNDKLNFFNISVSVDFPIHILLLSWSKNTEKSLSFAVCFPFFLHTFFSTLEAFRRALITDAVIFSSSTIADDVSDFCSATTKQSHRKWKKNPFFSSSSLSCPFSPPPHHRHHHHFFGFGHKAKSCLVFISFFVFYLVHLESEDETLLCRLIIP